MFFVYILYSEKDQRLYVGQTKNLNARLGEHNKGRVLATKHRLPVILLHQEQFSIRAIAMERERYLKSLYSARFKQNLRKQFLKKQKDLKQ